MIAQPAPIWYPDPTSLDALAARLVRLNPHLEERIVKARYLVNPYTMTYAPEPPGPFNPYQKADFSFQSTSNPAITYHVHYGDSCTCPDWVHRGIHLGSKRVCKHVIAYWLWRRLVTDQMNALVTDGEIKITQGTAPNAGNEEPTPVWLATSWQAGMLPFAVIPSGKVWDFPHNSFDGRSPCGERGLKPHNSFDGTVITFARHLSRRSDIIRQLAREETDAEREQHELARLTLAQMPL